MDAIRVNIRRPAVTGALLAALLVIAAGNATAENASSPQVAATPAGRPLVLDPEKDTVALQPRQGSIPSAGGADLRAPTAAVRVGQGLRFDGTEMMPSEESRPWLIRQ